MNSHRGPQPDRVEYSLVLELVEMLIGPGAQLEEIALAVGVSHAALRRYWTRGVPLYIAESLYDRVAKGLGPRKVADVYKEAV